MSKKVSLLLRFKVSVRSSVKVFARPAYIFLAIFGSLLTSGLILWSLNFDLIRYVIVEAPISTFQKLNFFFDVYKDIYTTYNNVQNAGVVIFSILFGINLALLVFVLKHRGFQSIPKKSGAGGFAMAIIGGGCIACGTSLIAPLLATFGASVTPLIRDLATLFTFVGILLITYSIYKLGLICSYIFASRA